MSSEVPDSRLWLKRGLIGDPDPALVGIWRAVDIGRCFLPVGITGVGEIHDVLVVDRELQAYLVDVATLVATIDSRRIAVDIPLYEHRQVEIDAGKHLVPVRCERHAK